MKLNRRTIFLLILLSQIFITSAYCQIPTTEGKEFWLAFMANEKTPEISISVSAKRACQLTIKNTNSAFTSTVNLQPGLNKIPVASTPVTEGYLTTSEVVENKSFLITATDTVSVFASNYIAKEFDVTYVLPANALKDEYMVQTYPNSAEKILFSPEFLIVATENNTVVDITPAWKTGGGNLANVKFSVTLNKGQSYQVQTENNVLASDLTGTVVKAQSGKKIAVFNGNQFEAIPVVRNLADSIVSGGNDGDHLYEQAMPVAYWGTEFIVTRSLNRAIDKMRITAKSNDTKVKRNGVEVATLQAGQTYAFDLKWPDKSSYIETSCPSAVYKYLVSSHKYDTSNFLGGPSMIWVSPLEQLAKEISFCTFNTTNTTNHYVNIVVPATNTSGVTLTGKSTGAKPLTFYPVDGNPAYSYARATIADDAYTLKSPKGVVADVYGLGTNESYGFSAGSAVKIPQSIMVNNKYFQTGISDSLSVCFGDSVTLFTEMKNVEQVTWNLGNGTTKITTGTVLKYLYPATGTYNVTATIKKKSLQCDDTGLISTVNAKLKVKNALEKHYYTSVCLPGNSTNTMPAIHLIDTTYYQCDSIVYHHHITNYETYATDTRVAFNSLKWIDGKTYYESTNSPTYTIKNKAGCDSIITLHLSIQECLEMVLDKTLVHNVCSNTTRLFIPYDIKKGSFSRYTAEFNANATASGFSSSSVTDDGSQFIVTFPDVLIPNNDTLVLTIYDELVCNKKEVYTIPFTIFYSDVIAQKWNDMLVVRSNTGFEFSHYQWYKNGSAIDGATSPIYYVGRDGSVLDFNADYSIELTRKNDLVKLMSCTMRPVMKQSTSMLAVYPTSMNAGESIHIDSKEACIVSLIDPVGVKQTNVSLKSGNNIINSPVKNGVYILNILSESGEQQSYRLIVK